MEIVGLVVSFLLVILLISRRAGMGLSLFIGALVAALLTPLDAGGFYDALLEGLLGTMTLELMVIVGLISGLGYIMKETGDLDQMIRALIALIRNTRALLMFVPALIGTLNVPGGAILSAPMIDESGDYLNMDGVDKNAVNIFFRHVGFLIYPLYPPMIIFSELMDLRKVHLIGYTFWAMLFGIGTAYLVMFRGRAGEARMGDTGEGFLREVANFFNGFFAILVILILALGFEVPFAVAVGIGVAIAHAKKLPRGKPGVLGARLRRFLTEGVDYALVLTIAGVMVFKAVIEHSGAVDALAESMIGWGFSLPLMIVLVGFATGYVTGVHVAAAGMLIPLFAPMFPEQGIVVYAALLFTAINVGYIVSPLHLCLALGNDYFKVSMGPVYRKLALPMLIMVVISSLLIFTAPT